MTKKRANGEGAVCRRKDRRVVGEYEDANGKTCYIPPLPWLSVSCVRYREKLGDWYYDVYCLLFNPGKKGFNETATLTCTAVARIRSRRSPYTG